MGCGAGVDMRRMESRRVPGLFLAGEVLDIDGITGGYNFQARTRVAPARTRRRQERLSVALLRIRVTTPHPSHDAASESRRIRVTQNRIPTQGPWHRKPGARRRMCGRVGCRIRDSDDWLDSDADSLTRMRIQ